MQMTKTKRKKLESKLFRYRQEQAWLGIKINEIVEKLAEADKEES